MGITLCNNKRTTADVWEDLNERIISHNKLELADQIFNAVQEGVWASIRWRKNINIADDYINLSIILDVFDDRNELENTLQGRLDRSYSQCAALEQLCLDMYEAIIEHSTCNAPDIDGTGGCVNPGLSCSTCRWHNAGFQERMTALGLIEDKD